MREFVVEFINDYFDGFGMMDAQQKQFSDYPKAISELFACDVKYNIRYSVEDTVYTRVASIYLHNPNFTVGPTIHIYVCESYNTKQDSITYTTVIGKMEEIEFANIGRSTSFTEELRCISIWKTPEYKDILIRESGLVRPCKSARK